MAKHHSINYPQNNLSRLKRFAAKDTKNALVENNTSVIYNRCSTEKQDSLDWQDAACEELCKREKFVLRKTWGEKVSAKTDDRVAFQEMVDYVLKNKIRHIVFYSYSRFSRTGDFALLKKLKKNGVKLHAVSQPVDDATPSGRFTEKLFLLFAELDNDTRRDTIMEGMEDKVRGGECLAKVPIGYEKLWVNGVQKDPSEKKQCFISDKGELIKMAFQWAEMNISQKEIMQRLSTMGLKVSTPQLSRILRNPFYCGQITSKLLTHGEFIQGKHQPLISVETFIRVNEILDGKHPYGWKIKKENEETPLKIFVKCDCCKKKSLYGYTKKGIYNYYKCPNPGCKINIKNTQLHELFIEKLSQFKIDPAVAPVLKEQLLATYQQMRDSETAREKPLKDELTRLKNELDKIELNFATNAIAPEIYNKFAPIHRRRIEDIDKELEALSKSSANLGNYIDSAINNASNLLNIWQLLDYSGKQRLQYLVFPSGMTYHKENRELRTDIINPIFKEISCFSHTYTAITEPSATEKTDELRKVYLTFASANYLYQICKDLHDGFEELTWYKPDLWQAIQLKQINTVTGATETIDYKYTSDIAGFVLSGTPITYSDHPSTPRFSGGTFMHKGYSGSTICCTGNTQNNFHC